jgi:7,8-dihydropterin-6-yl-methyl-4-(beta-D-ribofuranosyl)aminobenzene 5'-phosphate synthase
MRTTVIVFLAWLQVAGTAPAQAPQRITIIYDAFGAPSQLERYWGFAALIEYGGRPILFDTGNNAEVFARNVTRLQLDLSRLDAVVVSHRHGDHTSGLSYLLSVNPKVKIYTPQKGAFFGSRLPPSFLERPVDLPPTLQYFGGQDPTNVQTGSPWPSASFVTVTARTKILPGFFEENRRAQRVLTGIASCAPADGATRLSPWKQGPR